MGKLTLFKTIIIFFLLSLILLAATLYFYHQYNNGRYTNKANFSQVGGIVQSVDDNTDAGEWVIRLEGNSTLYRIRPINHQNGVSIAELKDKLPIGTQVTLTVIPFSWAYDVMGIESESVVIFNVEDAIRIERDNTRQGLIAFSVAVGVSFGVTAIMITIVICNKRKKRMFYEKLDTFDFRRNIEEARELFKTKPRSHNDVLPKPRWMDGNDELNRIYLEQKSLYKVGKVFYASLVQANMCLFERDFTYNCPAGIIFSPDPYFDYKPDELTKISKLLFSYKDALYAPPDLKFVTDVITDEMTRLFNFQLPHSITGGRRIYYTSVMVIRKHIPRGYLSDLLFPIVAEPTLFNTSIILPKRYWTKELKQHFTY